MSFFKLSPTLEPVVGVPWDVLVDGDEDAYLASHAMALGGQGESLLGIGCNWHRKSADESS